MEPSQIPTTLLSMDDPGFQTQYCSFVRRNLGKLRSSLQNIKKEFNGFISRDTKKLKVIQCEIQDSIIENHLKDKNHENCFKLTIDANIYLNPQTKASVLLADLLEGFLLNPPYSVTLMMRFRNFMVSPWKLRTSQLGCPVSSLLSPKNDNLFAGIYPVIDQKTNDQDTKSEVILGANDRHLLFRSGVSVELKGDQIEFTLSNRIKDKNIWGYLYYMTIDLVHRKYVVPKMLTYAVKYTFHK